MSSSHSPNLWVATLAAMVGAGVAVTVLEGNRTPLPASVETPIASPQGRLGALSHAFQTAADKARPSVLNITTERWIGAARGGSLQAMVERFLEGGRVRPKLEQSFGTGFVVRADGTALTNNHVVEGSTRVVARLHDGREVLAEVIGTDPLSDIAVLRLEPRPDGKPYIPVEFGDSDGLKVGDWVLALGNPFGLDQTVTAGIISAKGRSSMGIADYEDFIQTDAAINPGNSGGPLLDLDGRVVGVTTAIASQSGGYQGIGFAIPSAMAGKVMEDILDDGRVIRGWLGISVQTATPELAQRLGLGDHGGALVGGAVPGSPADKAGLLPGDLIVAVDGHPCDDATRLKYLTAQAKVSVEIPLRVIREGKPYEIAVTPIERPTETEDEPELDPAESAKPEGVGVRVRELTPELARYFGYEHQQQALVITDVDRGSIAAKEGIRPGMILQELDRTPIRSVDDLTAVVATIDKAQGVLLRVWDGEFSRFVLLRMR